MSVRALPSTLGPLGGSGPNGESTVAGIEVSQPADDSWVATAWLFDQDGTLTPWLQPTMRAWHGPEDWGALMPGDRMTLEVSRRGDRVTVAVGRQRSETVSLERVDASAQRQEIIRAFSRAKEKYPRFPLRLRYRLWTTYALTGGLIVQELSLLTIRRRAQRLYDRLRVLTMPLWVAGGLALAVVLGW
jgi:hypothetical protein